MGMHLNMERSIQDQYILILDVVGLEVILLRKVDGLRTSSLSGYVHFVHVMLT